MNQFLLIALTSLGTVIGSTSNQEETMQLVNTKTGFIVVEFLDGKAIFQDRFLEAELKSTGILIPPALRDQFDAKAVIFLDDPLFEKAFVKVYYPFYIANPLYEWRSISD